MPHVLAKRGIFEGTALAVFLALVHTVNDAITAMLGALLPTLQARFDASPTVLALMVATFWIASSLTQPVFGALAEDVGLRVIGALGIVGASLFLSLVGVAPELFLVFVLLVIGGLGSAALHPVGMTIAGGPTVQNRALGVGFFATGGMIGFALGPLAILYVVSRFGTDGTPWLMVPGLLLGIAVFALLPIWEPHGRRPLRALFDWGLMRGPLGALALGGSLAAVAFVTFTSSVPLWLVREHGYDTDAGLIGWTLAVFALGAGIGALLGGFLAPRVGRRVTIIGSLLLAGLPLAGVLIFEPGSIAFFLSAACAGALLYTSSPVTVVVAQDLAPHAPAAASGMIVGMTSAVAGVLYVGLGRLQEAIGLDAGIAVGFAMVVPAALTALLVMLRHPEVAGQ